MAANNEVVTAVTATNQDIGNQQAISMKIAILTENMKILLEKTMSGSSIYTMTEKLNFMKLTHTQYNDLFFEQELFDILLKNKYAIENNNSESDESVTYANTEYPFSLIICSKEACRSSILVGNIGMELIKFILYLRMLNQNVAPSSDWPNCLLSINMRLLAFGRICIDVDYNVPIFGDDSEVMNDDEYEKFIEKCFNVVCEMTTTGNIIMTRNCCTPNTRSFHMITEQQFDSATRQIIFLKISERIKALNRNVKIDQVHVWILPFGRGHTPVRKYNRKNNEFVKLAFPYTEADFELCMPFDLNLGIDNLHTLLSYMVRDDGGDDSVDDNNTLSEYLNGEVVHTYYIRETGNLYENLQLYVKVSSFKYDFAFRSQHNRRYKHNYLPQVLGHKYNNFFPISNKLLFVNNWQIPKPKIKQRPTEFYEIYRFISDKLLHGLDSMDKLFDMMPKNLVQRNVNIGNVDEILHDSKNMSISSMSEECEINDEYTGDIQFDLIFDDVANDEPSNSIHPSPYIKDNVRELSPTASVNTKNIYKFFRQTIVNNVYTYEKGGVKVMKFFKNIQSRLSHRLEYFTSMTNKLCNVISGDIPKFKRVYMYPMYEFFCRIHYIDACITTEEYEYLQNETLRDTIKLNLDEDTLEKYRTKYIEMSPCAKAYRKFPIPNTPLAKIWNSLSPENKIILHIIYIMIVEHNYTSIFVQLHNLSKPHNTTYLICSFLLNVIDDSYIDENDTHVQSYASKEFLNFIYRTFIDAGTNVKCSLKNGNVHLQSVISDLRSIFIGSPIWFFLGNFQYMDESMDFMKRFDIFAQIFQQQAVQEFDGSSSSGRQQQQGYVMPPPAKQAKMIKVSNFMPEKYFKMYNIPNVYHNDLLDIFCKYIIAFCKTLNEEYIYDGARFCPSTLSKTININAQIVSEPLKYSTIYRHQYGIYNTWTMQYERNTSILYTHITISNDEFAEHPELFNAYNEDIYKIMVNRFLKSITFTRVLKLQKNLGLLLAPIYDPNIESSSSSSSSSSATTTTLNYNIDSIQINIHDLSSSDYILPDEMLVDILKSKNKLYEMFKWLYAIICHYSESFSCKITTLSSFIPKCMVPEMNIEKNINSAVGDGVESSYSLFQQQQINDNRYTLESDTDNGENLIQRIHKTLNSKTCEQQQNITDELHNLSQQELMSLIILFDNIKKSDEDVIASSSPPLACEDIHKFNLSTRGLTTNDEFMENMKNELLLDLFNRKLSHDISQMTLENFAKIIEENFSQHITKFVLLTLSWFIRTTHSHVFSESVFFREIQQHRQQLYNELSELVFKHNGYFMYNNSIADITDIFGHYCRNVSLVVDPVFELSFPVDRNDMYLGYDLQLERRVSSEIIKDIEAGCVSAIYQGQFIEDTNVDLNRLWARVTVPRNRHRISPLFNLHRATGKSEYLNERCRKHFNNKYHNNFLSSTSLKSDHRGINIARELNANLIVCIEKFSDLTKIFKRICDHTPITYKPLRADTRSSFQNNATVILSTNNDLKCTEDAVITRLHVFPRRIQYANVKKYLKFQRTTVVSTATPLNTNNIFAVQLIMEKMPCVVAENYKGNFMMTWILKRFFLHNITDPVTVQASETLQNHIDMINVP